MPKEKNTLKKLILIDGNAIIHRSYHALPPFTTKEGELVNAVYGFASTVLSVIDKFKPDYIVASFDLAGPTFRHEKYVEYKAHRVKADDDLYAQIPRVKEVVKAFNIPIYEKQGFEADDVIGTIAKQIKEHAENIETIIVTGDMDTLQLVNDTTKVYTMRRGLSDAHLYDEDKVLERYGLKPEQLIDFKGLRGDPSDNIPGVKGIGEKTAITLLQAYGTVENVYANIGEIKGAIKDKLERDKAQAILSKDLATIEVNAPVKFELERAHVHDFDRATIVKLFNELNFYSLVKRLPAADTDTDTELNNVDEKKSSVGIKDFKFVIAKDKEIEKAAAELSKAKQLALALDVKEGELKGIAFSAKIGRAVYFPSTPASISALKEILANDSSKIGFDLKTIYKQLWINDLKLANMSFDVMLAAYVLNPGEKITLEKLILSRLGEEFSQEKKSKGQLSLVASNEDLEANIKFVCQQADYAFKLKAELEKEITNLSAQQKQAARCQGTVSDVLTKIEMPLIEILGKMELAGIELDTIIFQGISEKITKTLKNLEKSIYELAGKEFNINSPSQLAKILFEELKISTFDIKKTKTGLSTAAGELAKLRDSHKIIGKIEEYRELFKLKTTYLDTLPKLCDERSRVHTNFNQAVTATGRLSSTDPNLQNIPIKTELGQLLRTAFVAKDGYKLVSADYSQIDLRAVAHVSEDKKLIEAFHRGDDIHKITAAEINNVSLSEVTQKMRSGAKALNFGIIYGISSFGLSVSAGISREQAQKFIKAYLDKFSGVAKYMKDTREFARDNYYVETLLGRRRNLPEIKSPNFQIAAGAERMAINMPIQGLAADLMKLAMIHTAKEFEKDADVQMILQVHDEIILEVKAEKASDAANRLKHAMENVYPLRVPLKVDVAVGDNWGEI